MNVLLLRAGITQRPRVWDENKAPEYYEALRSSEVEPQLRLPVFIAFVKRSLLPTPTTGLEEDTLGGFSTEATGPMVCSFIISPNGDGLYADVLSAPLPKEGWRTEQPPRYLARLAPQTLQVEKRTALMDPGSSLLPNLTPEMSGLVPQEALEVIETPGTSIGGLSTAPDGSSLFLALTDTEEGTRLLRLNPETLEIQATGPKISGSDGFSFSQDQTSLYVKETATSRFVSLDPKTLNPQSPPFPEPILLVLPSPYGPDLFGLQEVREERGDWQLIQSRLVRLDPKTFQVLARSDQRFNVTPLHFAVSPDGSAVYNQEFESEQLLRMNPKNLQVDQRGPSLNRAAFLLLSSDGKALYTEDTQNHLLRLDPITLEVRARGPIVLYPIQLAPGGKALYGLDNHGRLIRLNSQTLKIEARFDQRIRGFAADPTDPAGNIVYVTRDGLEPTLLRLRALPLPAAGLEELKTLHPITRQILENIGAPPGSASEEIDDQSDSSVGLEELA